ncbi:MAG: PIN domain-containing protein [Treponema sp.]|nr:PIN domain-containing protein [Treponema sp.]
MNDRILIDSGPLIALFDADDNHHQKVRDFFSKHRYLFVSTLAVFTEVSHFLRFNVNVQISFFEWALYHGMIISEINQNDLLRISELTKKYADLPMDFSDATLVVASEKTGIREIVSLDKDFDIYRLPGKEKIKNVFYSHAGLIPRPSGRI